MAFQKNHTPWNKEIKYTDELKNRLNLDGLKLGRGSWGKGHLPWNKGTKGLLIKPKREASPLWRGGKQGENKLIRKSVEYRLWREAIFRRDNWTCIQCKIRGGELHADHIKPFAFFPELRFAIDNGRTLCVDCHKKTITWGFTGKGKRQMELIKTLTIG